MLRQPDGVVTESRPGARFVLSIDCGTPNAVIDEADARSRSPSTDDHPQCVFTNTYLFGSFHVRKDVTPGAPEPAGGWQFRLEGAVESCEGDADFVTDDTLADGEFVEC